MKNLAGSRPRNANLDLIRTIAILFVVLNHAVEEVFVLKYTDVNGMIFRLGAIGFTGFTLGRLGVPLFLFLTGYLYLPREFDKDSITKFYKKSLLPLVLVCQFWILMYSIFMSLFYKTPFDVIKVLFRLLFISSGTLPHSWYIPKIIGLYIFIPFVAIVLNRLSFKKILFVGSLVYFCYFCFPWIKNFLEHDYLDFTLTINLDLTFSGAVYGFYLLIGYLLARYKDKIDHVYKKRLNVMISIDIVILGVAATVALQMFFASKEYTYKVWYDCFLIPVISFCLFSLLMQVRLKGGVIKLLGNISVCSFGIYLVHELILKPSLRLLSKWGNLVLKSLVLFIGVFIISFLIVYIVGMIPKLKIIFLIKDRKAPEKTGEIPAESINGGT